MTWVKLTDTFADEFDALGAEAFATHVAALCYCNRMRTDGRLTDREVSRLPVADAPTIAAGTLVEAGRWAITPSGAYSIVGYLDDQPTAAEVHERIEVKRRYDRDFSRDRRQASPRGMSVTEYRAKMAAADGVTVRQWLAAQSEGRTTSDDVVTASSAPVPSRPVPSRPQGRDGLGEEEAAAPDGLALAGTPPILLPEDRQPTALCNYCRETRSLVRLVWFETDDDDYEDDDDMGTALGNCAECWPKVIDDEYPPDHQCAQCGRGFDDEADDPDAVHDVCPWCGGADLDGDAMDPAELTEPDGGDPAPSGSVAPPPSPLSTEPGR